MKLHSILQSLLTLLVGAFFFTACANDNETYYVYESVDGGDAPLDAGGGGGRGGYVKREVAVTREGSVTTAGKGLGVRGGRSTETSIRVDGVVASDAPAPPSVPAGAAVRSASAGKTVEIVSHDLSADAVHSRTILAEDIATGAVTTDEILSETVSDGDVAADKSRAPEIAFSIAPTSDAVEGGESAEFDYKGVSGEDIVREDADDSEEEEPQVIEEPGQLTAGEWSDLVEWDFWNGVVNSNDWSRMKDYWGFGKGVRISIRVDNGREPVPDAVVKLHGRDGRLIWTARSDNFGRAELFTGLNDNEKNAPYDIVVTSGGKETRLGSVDPSREQSPGESPLIARIAGDVPTLKTIDVMFMIDATGSMGDELNYVKAELESVINRVKEKLGEKEFVLRLSAGVYRDQGDAYVVRSTEFTEKIEDILTFIRRQNAGGGGDTPEAVEEALADAVEKHEWSAEAQSRFLFLLLDAPPHYTDDRLERMRDLTMKAAAKGIRIIPVAASGIDKETEFLLRFMGIHTGGTYVFLTDHSGIGESHLQPTIGSYQVEFLDDLLVRLIVQFTECPVSVDAIAGRRPELK